MTGLQREGFSLDALCVPHAFHRIPEVSVGAGDSDIHLLQVSQGRLREANGLAKVIQQGRGPDENKGSHDAESPEGSENVLEPHSRQKASPLPHAPLGDLQSRPPGALGSRLIGPIGTCHSLFYGLCTLTCVRVGSDVPSFRQYLLTVREGPLLINLLSSKHHDALVGQAWPWVWGRGPGAGSPCGLSPQRAGVWWAWAGGSRRQNRTEA